MIRSSLKIHPFTWFFILFAFSGTAYLMGFYRLSLLLVIPAVLLQYQMRNNPYASPVFGLGVSVLLFISTRDFSSQILWCLLILYSLKQLYEVRPDTKQDSQEP